MMKVLVQYQKTAVFAGRRFSYLSQQSPLGAFALSRD
jgi:hypothetical protein